MRTQAQRAEETTGELVARAAELFGRDGYAATSLDDVARAAGLTKGAVYHHFGGKVPLFRAALVRHQQLLAARLLAVAVDDPWESVRRGCAEFLVACLDPAVRQILLLDGPAVLGWAELRAIEDEHVIALLRAGLRRASPGVGGEARLHVLRGALCEAGLVLARDRAALPALSREINVLLDAYRA